MGVVRDAALTDHGFDQEDRPRLPAMMMMFTKLLSAGSPVIRISDSETTDEKEQQQGSNCTWYSTWTGMVAKLDLDGAQTGPGQEFYDMVWQVKNCSVNSPLISDFMSVSEIKSLL